MNSSRLEAFSDGVLAIILTIMVLELKVPIGEDFNSLKPFLPKILNYLLSFVYVGIYWNNHHHLFHAIQKVNGKVLWANLILLFWLSLLPVATSWMDQHIHAKWPVAIYGFILLMSSCSFLLIEYQALKIENQSGALKKLRTNLRKEKVSILVFLGAVLIAFVVPELSIVIYVLMSMIWIVPDKKIEKYLNYNKE